MQGNSKHIVLIGYGNMGRAMMDGWLETRLKDIRFTVIDPAVNDKITQRLHDHGVTALTSLTDDVMAPDMLIIAVKPQVMEQVCTPLKRIVDSKTCVLSIAAGTTVSFFEDMFGHNNAIIRTIPNTPAAIGEGVIIGYANAHVEQAHQDLAKQLLLPLGNFDWVDEEVMIDAATAIAGSGPAYAFLFMESLREAAVDLGFNAELANKIALQTVKGAACMATNHSEDVAVLRENVTSPGGTTASALSVLMKNNALNSLIKKAAQAAFERSKELSGN